MAGRSDESIHLRSCDAVPWIASLTLAMTIFKSNALRDLSPPAFAGMTETDWCSRNSQSCPQSEGFAFRVAGWVLTISMLAACQGRPERRENIGKQATPAENDLSIKG